MCGSEKGWTEKRTSTRTPTLQVTFDMIGYFYVMPVFLSVDYRYLPR